jgi:beta-phosphoglucomutase-like phosphatase (HAD superfamily)
VGALASAGVPLAAASSSRNAPVFLERIELAGAFSADVSGRRVARGKPAPDLFLAAADALGAEPRRCLVVEDAPAGVAAAKAAGMTALGLARHDDAAAPARADRVVSTLDDVDVTRLLGEVYAR